MAARLNYVKVHRSFLDLGVMVNYVRWVRWGFSPTLVSWVWGYGMTTQRIAGDSPSSVVGQGVRINYYIKVHRNLSFQFVPTDPALLLMKSTVVRRVIGTYFSPIWSRLWGSQPRDTWAWSSLPPPRSPSGSTGCTAALHRIFSISTALTDIPRKLSNKARQFSNKAIQLSNEEIKLIWITVRTK